MRLAGEIADGALLNYLVSPAYNADALEAIGDGAARAGRDVYDIDRPQLVACSMDDDRDTALDAARLLVTQYLGQQPHIMKASGVPAELLDEIAKVLTWPATHDQVVAMQKKLADAGGSKIIVYDDAGHAFYADYRPSYVKADAEASWKEATAWLKEHGV